MDRTLGGNNVDIGAGRRGFRDRNLALGLAGTLHTALHHNGLQEEILRTIELTGIVPNGALLEQLFAAIRRLANGTSFQLNAGTYTLSADQLGWVQLNAGAGGVSVNLPGTGAAGTGNGQLVTFARLDGTANPVVIAAAAGETIEGLASISLGIGQRVTLRSNAAGTWFVVGGSLGGSQAFFSNGTFVVPPLVRQARVRCWGAGSGGGVFAAGAPSAGGSGGGYAEGVYNVTPGASIAVTVGVGGVANTAGGSSSFGAYCSATGGQSGPSNTTTGTPGTGSGGQINLFGGGGGLGVQLSTAADRAGGAGGNAPFGSLSGVPWVGGASVPGGFPGGGASGQAAAGSTASGASGLVIVGW